MNLTMMTSTSHCLVKTVVILTISGRRQEKTVDIKSSYFKCHYYELSSRSSILGLWIISNVKTPFRSQMKIEIPGEALGGRTRLEKWHTWSTIRICVARQHELANDAPYKPAISHGPS